MPNRFKTTKARKPGKFVPNFAKLRGGKNHRRSLLKTLLSKKSKKIFIMLLCASIIGLQVFTFFFQMDREAFQKSTVDSPTFDDSPYVDDNFDTLEGITLPGKCFSPTQKKFIIKCQLFSS